MRIMPYPVPLVLAVICAANLYSAQGNMGVPVFPFTRDPCESGQFFDTAVLACSPCPEGAVPSTDQRSCVSCDSSSGSLFLFQNGFALTQAWTAASRNGGTCSCDAGGGNSVVATVMREGAVLQRCITCPAGTSPNAASEACVPDGGSLANTTPLEDLEFVVAALGLSINIGAATEATFPSRTISDSVPLALLLGPSAKACLQSQSRRACNAVANLCVLQLYSRDAGSCVIYDRLVTQLALGSNATEPRPATGPLPWLFYTGDKYSQAKVGLKVHFGSGGVDTIESGEPVSQFTFVLSAHALNGTWLGFHEWQKHFQLCGIHTDEGRLWRNFGWEYRNDCEVDLASILEELPKTREPIFYDAFLRTGQDALYPVPVKVNNFDEAAGNSPNSGAVRRFFYVDGALGTSQDGSSSGSSGSFEVVQYPSMFRLEITQRPDPTDEIFPPQVFVTYASRQVGPGQADALSSIQFSVEYLNGGNLEDSFSNAFTIMLIVFLVAIAFPLFCLKMFQAYRRRKDAQSDQDLFIYVGVCLVDVASFALFLVVGLVGLYQLILYKMQAAVFFMIPRDEDLVNFRATAIVAIVGQAVGLLYMLWKQVTTDIFFLDWERPRKVLSRDGLREEDAEVSAWRLLTIVNKFAELQTIRVTCPAFTLLMMVMILVGANVQTAGDITPKEGDFENTYRTTQPSIVLRWGIQTAFFLVLFLGQYMFRRLLYFPYVSHPITNFVDLMYLANISAIILDERHVGSYIHGRNNAQHADTTLRGLNHELEKEGEGIVAHRGFIPTYQGSREKCENQVFQIYITEAIRRQYDAMMTQKLLQVQNEARMRQGQMMTFIKGTGKPEEAMLAANDDVAALFREMISDVERNYATQVVDPSYLQLLIQLPPEASALNTVFVHDYFRSFTETMFFGNEVRLFVFEALFFMSIDLALNNAPISGLITYVMVRAVALIRKFFGTLNLSQKTTVDLHFLV